MIETFNCLTVSPNLPFFKKKLPGSYLVLPCQYLFLVSVIIYVSILSTGHIFFTFSENVATVSKGLLYSHICNNQTQ